MEFIKYWKSSLVKVAQSVDWSALWNRSRAEFLSDVVLANERFFINTKSYNSPEFVVLLLVILANFTIDIVASFILSRRTKSTILLCIAEVLGLSKVLLACFLPGSAMKLLYGLVIFASGLGVHARVCDQLQLNEERPDGSRARFFHEAFNTLYFNVLSRMGEYRGPCFPHFFRIFHGLSLLGLIDLCTYIIREWIPLHVSPANQTIAMAIVGGVWAVFSMEMSYICGIVQSDLMGIPMSMELRHRHPLMSSSLSEFWGIRWNPIVGKLLQDSFYKPCRRIGVSRAGCVIACFTGSAILHAIPQYIATQSGTDCAMMFAFFFLQGVCLMTEVAVQKMCGFGKKKSAKKVTTIAHSPTETSSAISPAAESPVKKTTSTNTDTITATTATSATTSATAVPHHSVAYKTAPYQFPAELLTLVFVVSTSYLVLECLCVENSTLTEAQKGVWIKVAVTSGIGASVLYYTVRNYIYQSLKLRSNKHSATNLHAKNIDDSLVGSQKEPIVKPLSVPRIPLQTFVWSYLGWLWTILSVVLLLPLFALPVLHAVQPLYSQSFVVGSIVRTVEKVVLPVIAKYM